MSLALAAYTILHTALSLIGIFTGFVVLAGMFRAQKLEGWTKLFLATTVLTSVTGFFFPFEGFKPSYVVGAISLVLLAVAIYAWQTKRLVGKWRWIFVVTAMISQYLNVFVLVVQAFAKVPPLHALAPTQSEPPFAAAQGAVLLAFVVLIAMAVRKFRIA